MIPISSLPPYVQKFFSALMAAYVHAKFTVVAAGLAASVYTVVYTVKGAPGFKGGTAIFYVPAPSFGTGLSFLLAAVLFGVYKLIQARRSVTE